MQDVKLLLKAVEVQMQRTSLWHVKRRVSRFACTGHPDATHKPLQFTALEAVCAQSEAHSGSPTRACAFAPRAFLLFDDEADQLQRKIHSESSSHEGRVTMVNISVCSMYAAERRTCPAAHMRISIYTRKKAQATLDTLMV